MYSIIEITLYPLTAEYEGHILEFLERLNAYGELDITTGQTSTVIRGPYDEVMEVLRVEMKRTLDGPTRMSFVLKVLNAE